MDRERLMELLQDPSQVAKQDLTALRNMAERFPWFSGAHLLLAVGEHETGDVLANDRLSMPAAYLPSRAVLFDLLRQEEQQRPTPLRVVKDVVPLPPLPPAIEPEPLTEQVAVIPVLEDAAPPFQGTISPTIQEGNSTLSDTLSVEAVVTPVTRADAILEQQIQESILAAGYSLERSKLFTGTVPTPPAHIPSSAPPPPPPPAPQDNAQMADVTEMLPSLDVPPPVQPIAPGTRLRFTDWLERSDEEMAKDTAVPSQPRDPVDSFTGAEPTMPTEVDAGRHGFDAQELMDQFIQRSSPRPSAAKAEFFNPQQAAKRSLQDDGLVSETLARIHEKQGNFAKAKEVYDRLAVKHPEKSVYFAALSKALEGRMHK